MNCRSCFIIIYQFQLSNWTVKWDYKKEGEKHFPRSLVHNFIKRWINNQHSSSSKIHIFLCVWSVSLHKYFGFGTHFCHEQYIHTLFAHHRYYHVIKIHSLNILHVENIFRLKIKKKFCYGMFLLCERGVDVCIHCIDNT